MVSKGAKVLLVASTLWIFGDGMLGPLFAIFTEKIGGNVFDITSAWATYLSVTGVGIIVVGKVSDQIGKKWLMLLGYILSVVFTFGYLLVDSPNDLFIVQIGLGLALALSQPTWLALYDKYSGSGENDGFLWGLADGLGYMASAVAILAGGFIVTHYSFDVLFTVMGIVLTLSTIYQAKIIWFEESSKKS